MDYDTHRLKKMSSYIFTSHKLDGYYSCSPPRSPSANLKPVRPSNNLVHNLIGPPLLYTTLTEVHTSNLQRKYEQKRLRARSCVSNAGCSQLVYLTCDGCPYSLTVLESCGYFSHKRDIQKGAEARHAEYDGSLQGEKGLISCRMSAV